MKLFVTGGSASGKSEYAGKAAEALSGGLPVLYIATLADRSSESVKRVMRHEMLRKSGRTEYVIAECFSADDLCRIAEREAAGSMAESGRPRFGAVLFDSLDGFTADEMFGTAPFPSGLENFDPEVSAERTSDAVLRTLNIAEHAVIVTDDIFRGGSEYGELTEKYMKYTALTGRRLADMCDAAAEVIYGFPVILKGRQDEFPEIDGDNAVTLY